MHLQAVVVTVMERPLLRTNVFVTVDEAVLAVEPLVATARETSPLDSRSQAGSQVPAWVPLVPLLQLLVQQ